MGNGLILYPLYKISSLHPSSKCLFSNLACTDIRVGLIFQPSHLAYIISQEHSPICYHGSLINRTLGVIFCGVSVLTLTAISTDRLLAVSLGFRYRQEVTLVASKSNSSPLLACLYYKRNNKQFHPSYLFDNQ